MAMHRTRSLNSGFEPRIGRSVSLDHAAELLGVSRRTIYNRIREGRLQTIRTLGGSQRVLLDSVQRTSAGSRSDSPLGARLNATDEPMTDNPSRDPDDRRARAVVAALRRWSLLVFAAAPRRAARTARASAPTWPITSRRGSQTIDVIVHGTRAEVDALAARYNLRVKRYLQERRGAAGERRPARGAAARTTRVDHLSGDIRIQSRVARRDGGERSAPTRCGRARASCRR